MSLVKTFSETVPGYRKQSETERWGLTQTRGVIRAHRAEAEWYTDKEDQLHKGDGIIIRPKILLPIFEVKTEKTWTGNLFAEIWSNRHGGRYGWMTNLDLCDVLVMHFKDRELVYYILMQKLRALDLSDYDLVLQEKNEQANDSWGKLLSWGFLGRRGCLITEREWLG